MLFKNGQMLASLTITIDTLLLKYFKVLKMLQIISDSPTFIKEFSSLFIIN